jgi:hypothetical protein
VQSPAAARQPRRRASLHAVQDRERWSKPFPLCLYQHGANGRLAIYFAQSCSMATVQ